MRVTLIVACNPEFVLWLFDVRSAPLSVFFYPLDLVRLTVPETRPARIAL